MPFDLSLQWFAARGVTDRTAAEDIRMAVIGWIDEVREYHHAGACPKCVDIKTAERERCAKIADEYTSVIYMATGVEIAARIREGQ